MLLIFVLFTAMFLLGWRLKGHLMTGGNVVLFMYAFSSGCALAVYPYYPPMATLESVLYMMTGVLLCLWPLIRSDVFELPVINGARERSLINGIAVFAMVLGTFSIVSFIRNSIRALSIGVGQVRNEVYEGNIINEGGVLTWGFVGNLSMLSGGAWMLILILACVSALQNGRSLATILLFVGSLCGIPYGLSVGGRSPIIYYSMMLTFLVVMFFGRNQILRRNRFMIVVALLSFLVGVFGYSYYVADNRDLVTTHIYSAAPVKTREGATLFTMLDYAGQGIVNFHTYWAIRWTDERLYHGGMNLPLFAGFLKRLDLIPDYSIAEVNDDMMTRYEYEGGFGATFSTFLREFIMDFGEIGTLLICALIGLCLYLSLARYNRLRDLSSLMVIVSLASIPLLGIFYSYFPSMFGTGMFFITLAAAGVLRAFGGQRQPVPRSVDKPVGRPVRRAA